MADSASGKVTEPKATQGEIKRHSGPVNFLLRLVKEKPLGTIGGVITLILLFTGIFANFIAPYGLNEVNMGTRLVPPGFEFWLGTDNLGRDVLSRVIFGARVSVIIGLAGATMAVLINLFIGVLSGYIGGKFDLVVQRIVDSVISIPSLIILIVIMAFLGSGMLSLILTLGIWSGIAGSRIIRSAVIGIKENVYVAAAVAIGCPTSRILIKHLLPNIMAPLIIIFSLTVPGIILTEASLSFLGYGIAPPTPSWGGMIGGEGRRFMFIAPWMIIWPGVALAVVVYGINMFGDAVRDILDPRMRGGIGRYGIRQPKKKPR